ncbi:hydroxymethylglutaryl-CoA lyase [Microbulbifer bruguierae]|uniref:Hydroxymethylglutaryl-CoA lyase n=1 Tax=Microbulbifer bruguierae TaxID=3029061 RepID=A0ABY8NBI2_9GAMM|nr:hydroxymethylglutaryl-CoA lyase [Microbulbifer bruguierae]WGL16290.1 hydroxymethylglutaryl-CoA lyase [Microbulbifer bruguierae]
MDGKVIVNEVGPRDGLQNQPKILSVAERVQLVEALAAAGVNHIEVGAFVSPKAVPAMAGTDQVMTALSSLQGISLSALIPNLRGYELARAAGVETVAMVLYASDGMAQRNVKMTRAEAEADAATIIARAAEDGARVIATIAVAFSCPFDGPTDPLVVRDIAQRFVAQGAERVVIADSIGAGNPLQVRQLMDPLVASLGAERLGCHFHDTRAMGLANVFAALESGVRYFDASIGGLGGCPFAPGATGNVATEDVVMMLEQMGVSTGIDLDALMRASELSEVLTGTAPGGRAKSWLKPWLERRRLAVGVA